MKTNCENNCAAYELRRQPMHFKLSLSSF